MKNVSAPKYSEQFESWVVVSWNDELPENMGKNTAFYATEEKANAGFQFKLARGYTLVNENELEPVQTMIEVDPAVVPAPAVATERKPEAIVDTTLDINEVMATAAKQDRVHYRDVSYIMDALTVRQCRAFVNYQGFQPDQSLTWAINLGLIKPAGGFTDKGRAFLGSIS